MSEQTLNFKVTRLHRLEGNGRVKAFVDIAVNDLLLVKGMKILEGKNGLFVSMPQEKSKDNKWYDTVSPLTQEAKEDISSVILSAYNGN